MIAGHALTEARSWSGPEGVAGSTSTAMLDLR